MWIKRAQFQAMPLHYLSTTQEEVADDDGREEPKGEQRQDYQHQRDIEGQDCKIQQLESVQAAQHRDRFLRRQCWRHKSWVGRRLRV